MVKCSSKESWKLAVNVLIYYQNLTVFFILYCFILSSAKQGFCGTDTHFTRIAACHTSREKEEEIKVLIGHLSPGLCLQTAHSEQAPDLSLEGSFRLFVTLQPQNVEKC